MTVTKRQVSVAALVTLALATMFNRATGMTGNSVGTFLVWSTIWLAVGVSLSLLFAPRDAQREGSRRGADVDTERHDQLAVEDFVHQAISACRPADARRSQDRARVAVRRPEGRHR
jgi:hypothetical protein